MSVTFDNLCALLITGIVVLIAAFVLQRGTQASVEAHGYYDLRKRTDLLVATVRGDLANVGADVDADAVWAPTPHPDAGPALTQEFRFAGNVEGDGAVEHVKYRLDEVPGGCEVYDPATASASQVPCYRLVRELCDLQAGQFVACAMAGQGSVPLTEFRVVLLDDAGSPALGPGEARQIGVHFAAVPSDGPNRVVPHTRWSSQFRPVNLQ